ncbi:MAG: hypothetical protein MJA82_07285 [Clostridia bacterium]|nr:hypothetical protein [Clostridia bacterium]
MYQVEIKRINITFVYENLTETFISRDYIKKSFNDVQVIDIPDDILLINFQKRFKNCSLQAVFDQKRLSTNLNIPENLHITDIDLLPLQNLIQLTFVAHESIESSKLESYGFNFTGIGKFTKNNEQIASEVFKNIFLKDPIQLERNIKGKITSFAPKFTVEYDDFVFNVNIDVINESPTDFHININDHFDSSTVPERKELLKKLKTFWKKNDQIMKKIHNRD